MGPIELAELIGLVLLVAAIAAIALVAIRRSLLSRAGAVDVCWRYDLSADDVGWTLGQARFSEGMLELHRSFSLSFRPSRGLAREHLTLGERRPPMGTELDLLPVGAVVVRCTEGRGPFELAMSEDALTGLRSWIESLPPSTRAFPGTGLKER